MLNIIDEFTRECLAIRVDRKLKANDVIDALSDLFILRGIPQHIRSDTAPGGVSFTPRLFALGESNIWCQNRQRHRTGGPQIPISELSCSIFGGRQIGKVVMGFIAWFYAALTAWCLCRTPLLIDSSVEAIDELPVPSSE